MFQRIADGLSWRWHRLRRCLFLLTSFRNGAALASSYWRKEPCDRAVRWDGVVLRHPKGRSGLAQTLVEVWFDQVYTRAFYAPCAGDVVIDGGANIGLFSIWVATLEPLCRVIAVEPFEENYEFLSRNAREAGLTNVQPIHAALWGHAGFVQIQNGGSRSLDHRTRMPGAQSSAKNTIRAVSLRDVIDIAQVQSIALFKIDIEGSEYELLAEASKCDLERIQRFAIEYHDNLRPGTCEFLKTRLNCTHICYARPAGTAGYGMLYATLRAERSSSPEHQ